MYIYTGNDHIAAITDKIDADSHSHLMLQISISFHNEFTILVADKQFACKGIIINSNTNHTFYSNQDAQIFFLIDNTSAIAKQIKQQYFDKLQKRDDGYYGYAIAIEDKCAENLCFTGKDTYSQSLAITDDVGIYDSPELFFKKYNNTPSPLKQFLFEKIFSKRLNKRLQKIRNSK